MLIFYNACGGVLYKSFVAGFIGSSLFKRPKVTVRIGRNCFLRGGQYIVIHEDVVIGDNVILTAWDHFRNQQKFKPTIILGSGSMIGDYCNISAINTITLGQKVLLGRFVTIIDHSHGAGELDLRTKAPWDRDLTSKGGISIGNNVWVGDKATILPNVTIGDNCIIGANSVVTKSFPRNCVIGGNPAKIIRQYD